MTGRADPKGYYACLGVTPGANADEIKNAYRARAMELHPDRNPGKDTTRAFQDIQEAYKVLSDARARAEYDSIGMEAEQDGRAPDNRPMEPIVCSKCGCVSAQPRYAIFYEVKSFVFGTRRSARQGIFCAECAAKEALKASALTWLLGWWCFPWGPIYTVHALFTNMFGGERPTKNNAHLMAYQAAYFAYEGKVDLARAVAIEALALAIKINTPVDAQRHRLGYDADETGPSLVGQIKDLLRSLDDGRPFKQLKPQWGFFNRILAQQGAGALAVCGVIAWFIMSPTNELPRAVPAKSTVPEEAIQAVDMPPVEPMPLSGRFRRYVKLHSGDPMPPFKISTNPDGPNWLVKLYDQESNSPVMSVFVRAGESVEVKVPVGTYAVRFASGALWYGEENLFGPDTDYSIADKSLEFSVEENRLVGYELSLTAIPNGNLKRNKVAASEF